MSAPQKIQRTYTAEVLLSVRRKGEKISLTDFWKLAGSLDKKSPSDWQSREATTELVDTLCEVLNTPKMGVLESTRGRTTGGTWAHKSLALAYAKWLDPKLHLLVNQVFFERIEEEANPELAVQRGNERARKTWLKCGKDEKWIEARIKGVATRKHFANVLAAHGVVREGYRNCTNATYSGLYGGSTEVVRLKKNLDKKVSILDNMDEVELAATQFAEVLALDKIQKQGLRGNAQCELACTAASKAAANAIMQSRKV